MRYDLHHVSIPVGRGQLDAGRAFYQQALGLEEIPAPAEFPPGSVVWFRLGDQELHLFMEEGANTHASGRHFALAVDDLEAARQLLAANDVEIEDADPIHNRPRLFVRDPFGNRFEITTILGPYRE